MQFRYEMKSSKERTKKDIFVEQTLIKALCLMISFAMLVLSAMPAAIYAEDEVVDPSTSILAENESTDSSEPVVIENETTESPVSAAAEGESTDQTADGVSDIQETNASEASDEQNPDASEVSSDQKPDALAEDEEVEKPEVPQIKVTIKDDGLCVKWDKLKGAKSYKVYRSYKKKSGYKVLKKGIKGSSFTDKTVASGKTAYYKVRALKKDGGYTKSSEVASGIIYRVYIETGHGLGHDGRWDPGCSWKSYQEAKLMIPICKAATKYLRKKGVYVYTDAYNKNNMNLIFTLRDIRKYDVSVLLNVHCDYKLAPSGTMPLYRYSDQKKLARCINKGVHEYVDIADRGLVKRKDLKTLNKTRGYCVACLFETGSIRKDNKLLRTQYDAYGKGLAKGVCDYLGIE